MLIVAGAYKRGVRNWGGGGGLRGKGSKGGFRGKWVRAGRKRENSELFEGKSQWNILKQAHTFLVMSYFAPSPLAGQLA
jgi:hypothetical protein